VARTLEEKGFCAVEVDQPVELPNGCVIHQVVSVSWTRGDVLDGLEGQLAFRQVDGKCVCAG
jgi:hypothetical protein